MDTLKENKQGMREMIQGYEMEPSARVWEGIEAASPAPRPIPRKIRPWMYGAAAVIIIAGIVMLMIPSGNHQNGSDMDQIEVFVPELDNDTPEADAPEVSATPDVATVASTIPAPAEQENAGIRMIPPSGTVETVRPDNTKTAGSPSGKLHENDPAKITSESLKPAISHPAQTPSAMKSVTEPEVVVSNKNFTSKPDDKPLPAEKLKVFIPNAFAPNSDGTNDIFRPVVKDNAEVTDYLMQIYTRSGSILFESSNIMTGWDGRYHGVPVDDQVCVYVITFRDLEGNPYRYWGTVVLVK